MAKSTKKTTKTVLSMPAVPTTTSPTASDGEIAARAFTLYCERGREHGHDVEDWLRAERELRVAVQSTAA